MDHGEDDSTPTNAALDAAEPNLRAVADAFARLGRSLVVQDPAATLRAVAGAAVEQMRGASAASITSLRHGQFQTVASTSERADRADAIQYAVGSGPCIDAIVDDALYRPLDLRTDARWPEFGRRVARQEGFLSMVSYRLAVEGDDAVQGLNVYADAPGAFDDNDVLTGLMLATHGAVAAALAANRERVDHLETALRSNREIGMAMGVLMALHKLTQDQAFDLLRMASQNANRKLHDVAVAVVDTGVLPSLARRRASQPREDDGEPA